MNLTGKWNWVRPLLLCLILTATSGCVTASTVPVANSYCAIAKPISYASDKDAHETVRQIEAHNSQWVCLCEQDCPASVPDTK
jgi:hypothetical protein